jgi:group I intron endonuclease
MYGIIYKATSPTGKVYIGKTTKTLEKRKQGHKAQAVFKDKRTTFQIALLEHGFSAFTWEQIDSAETLEELDYKEKYWVSRYKADDLAYGYNIFEGGSNPKHTPETRKKMSKAMKGKFDGEKHPQYGKHRSPETCKKISEAQKGKIISLESRKKMSESGQGKHSGEKNSNVKLTEIKAKQIKLALANGETGATIVKKFGVSKQIVSKIKCGRAWAWLKIGA